MEQQKENLLDDKQRVEGMLQDGASTKKNHKNVLVEEIEPGIEDVFMGLM